jgi:hypothetical protein
MRIPSFSKASAFGEGRKSPTITKLAFVDAAVDHIGRIWVQAGWELWDGSGVIDPAF